MCIVLEISCVAGPETSKLWVLAEYQKRIVLEHNINAGANMLQHATVQAEASAQGLCREHKRHICKATVSSIRGA